MRPFLSVLGARFRMQLQYRAAALAGLTTQVFFGLIIIMIYRAYYANATETPPIAIEQLVSFVWLSQILYAMMPWTGAPELNALARSGDICFEMLRPVGIYWRWFARCLAWKVSAPLMRGIPMIILAGLFFGLGSPASIFSGFLFAFSLIGVALLAASISVIWSAVLLWSVVGEGLRHLSWFLVGFFSGLMLPLPLMPDWLRTFCEYLPFRGLVDTPYRIYIGSIAPGESLGPLASQFAWIIILIFLGRALIRLGENRLTVQGG